MRQKINSKGTIHAIALSVFSRVLGLRSGLVHACRCLIQPHREHPRNCVQFSGLSHTIQGTSPFLFWRRVRLFALPSALTRIFPQVNLGLHGKGG